MTRLDACAQLTTYPGGSFREYACMKIFLKKCLTNCWVCATMENSRPSDREGRANVN